MPPRTVSTRRSGPLGGALLAAVVWCVSPASGQELLPLQRDYPGSGPYQCPTALPASEPSPEIEARANQLASEANQAMVLGDLERAEVLLGQAVQLNRRSADLAYRHARVLEQLGTVEPAMEEFCRAIDLDVAALGVFDARDRIDSLAESIREQIPVAAHNAFREGVLAADDSLYFSAIESFTTALEAAPDWPPPLYNRAVVYERVGQVREALADFRAFLDTDPNLRDAVFVLVSERIGELEGAASVVPPNPMGAFALGLIPGMGHFYTGRPVVGTLTLTAAGGAIAAGLLFRKVTTLCLDTVGAGGACPDDQVVDESTERPYLTYALGAAAAVTVVAAVEALWKARQRRAEAEALLGPLSDDADSGLTLELPSVSSDGVRVDLNVLSVRFR